MRTTRLRYGEDREQVATLRLPRRAGPVPLLVVIHGGFWQRPFGRWLMVPWVRAATRRGWATVNVGYRRLGRRPGSGGGGWPATFDDVLAAFDRAVDHVRSGEGAAGVGVVDLDRVAVCGHSAGGHLALWLAADRRAEIRLAVGVAAVTDLEAACGDASSPVARLVAAVPDARRWQLTSPAERLPIGTELVLVHGSRDRTVDPSMSRRFVDRARAAGDVATLVVVEDEGHRIPLLTSSGSWRAVVDVLDDRLGAPAPSA